MTDHRCTLAACSVGLELEHMHTDARCWHCRAGPGCGSCLGCTRSATMRHSGGRVGLIPTLDTSAGFFTGCCRLTAGCQIRQTSAPAFPICVPDTRVSGDTGCCPHKEQEAAHLLAIGPSQQMLLSSSQLGCTHRLCPESVCCSSCRWLSAQDHVLYKTSAALVCRLDAAGFCMLARRAGWHFR